jgi:hypothetical protein
MMLHGTPKLSRSLRCEGTTGECTVLMRLIRKPRKLLDSQQSGSVRPSVSEEKVEEIRTALQASRELYAPRTRLHLFAHKVQINQEVKPNEEPKRPDFATDTLHRIDTDPSFFPTTSFPDEAIFHQQEKVSRHITHIWGFKNPHVTRKVVQHTAKVNVWCGLMKDRFIGPFFFMEATVTGGVYRDLLVQFVYLQVAYLHPNTIYQQDGTTPNWSVHVQETHAKTLPDREI